MAEFLPAYTKTNGHEGGCSFNPADLGNVVVNGRVTIPTYKGIAPKFWPKWGGWKYIAGVIALLVPMPEYATEAYYNWVRHLNRKLAELTVLQNLVIEFYRTNFWDKNRLGEIDSQAVANWIYDHAVNGGTRGIMWAQLAARVKPDGAVGPATLTAINGCRDTSILLSRMSAIAGAYRVDRCQERPGQLEFLVGWLRRDGQPESVLALVRQAAADGRLDDNEEAKIKAAMEAA